MILAKMSHFYLNALKQNHPGEQGGGQEGWAALVSATGSGRVGQDGYEGRPKPHSHGQDEKGESCAGPSGRRHKQGQRLVLRLQRRRRNPAPPSGERD